MTPYRLADEADFVALFQTAAFGRWFGDGMRPEAEDRAVFGRIFSLVYAEERFPVWAVRRDGIYVGHAEIKPSPESWLDGHEIIYGLDPRHQRHGFGTEVAKALTEYGHGELGLSEVHATVHAENAASLALLRGLGYVDVKQITADDGHTTCLLTSVRGG
ncbi:GNAT family N-acetyltransferase [Streptomyces tsukubensis]|uniref:GNAT family N-acetyltransferase n=2 Tax=Streptomyces tsukubensis TaxID=83656 RepID=A0A1V4AA09_9ACTN|nr:GNAT family N-acetyltransferase [Streptomyces tsukubensis]QFR98084.1 GNAT family N-acetyltransferase [Streptomyces tsukubensis]